MPKITEVYAWVSTDADPSDEGVIGWNSAMGWIPLVGADLKRIESVRHLAQATANITKKPVRLLRFSVREELETVTPK